MNSVLQSLSPAAQVILLVCLLLLIAGTFTLLLVVTSSRLATENLCYLLNTIIGFIKPGHVKQPNPHNQLKQKAFRDTETLHLADKSE